MTAFFTLLTQLIPLYIIILVGLIAGRYLNVKKESIASLLIYVIAPVVVFNGAVTAKISLGTLSLPVLFYVLCCLVCLLFYFVSKFIWRDSTRNILAFAAGAGNTGYFGLPVALALYGEQALSLVILAIIGVILFENTLGFYITARGSYTARESIKKVIKLPSIYAFIIGLMINISGMDIDSTVTNVIVNFRGAYAVLGMMLIGLALADKKFILDYTFISMTIAARFLVWPLIMFAIILLDNHLFLLYNSQLLHQVMMLMSMVPIAANTVAYATELNVQPQKVSLAVLFSTFFALIYIPLVITLLAT